MKNKKFNIAFLALLMLFILAFQPFTIASNAEEGVTDNNEYEDLGLTSKSAVLMEASTGEVIYAKNPNEALPPASVTKIMTLLLIMEEIDNGRLNYSDMVTASANASSMGGSQIFLKEGESMSVEDMLKSIVIASANDAAVAMAEHICGSEEAFVARMNQRAKELSMKNTNFENTNGLDDTVKNHKTSAMDIAIMSRELIKHKKILEYSSIWMDTIRNGSFGLTNTNRLIRFYKGATGLKTGSTAKAGFCISATAKRDGMDLICVIMAAESRDIRNSEAKKLLDYGFANYELFTCKNERLGEVKIFGGTKEKIGVEHGNFVKVVKKGTAKNIEKIVDCPKEITAPKSIRESIGKISFVTKGEILGEIPIICSENVKKINFWELLLRMISGFFLK